MGRLNKIMGTGMALTDYSVVSENIPEDFDGFKIIHLSDFHCMPKKGMLNGVYEEKPDIICITGDMADDERPYGCFLKLLAELLKISPVYMVSGNHDAARADYERFVGLCRKTGAVFLRDEGVCIERGEGKIFICGIDDPALRVESMLDERIKESVDKIERKDGYEILLFHRANKLELLKKEKFDLIVSGHMHGGQIKIPRFGGVFAPKSGFAGSGRALFPEFSGGRYKLGSSDVIVNCGMGNPVPLPRFGNPTEIVSIVLRHKK